MRYRKANPFYVSKEWRRVRKELLAVDKYECQDCKTKGYYKRANHVHHVNYIDKHPELALEKYYKDRQGKEQRNLISLCEQCHMLRHDYQHKPKEPLTEERW